MKVYAVEAKTWGRLDMQSGTLKKRTIAVIAAFAAVIVLMAPMTAHASTSYVSDVKKKTAAAFAEGSYTLTVGGYSLQAAVKTGAKRTNVNIGTKKNDTNQIWTIKPSGENGYYYLIEGSSGLYLDVKGAKSDLRTNVQLYTSGADSFQKWKFVKNSDSTYTIYSKETGLVLDVAGGQFKSGTNIQIYKPNNTKSQKFTIQPLINPSLKGASFSEDYYEIKCGDFALRAEEVNGENNTNVSISEALSAGNLIWKIVPSGENGYYYLTEKSSGQYLDIEGGGTAYRTNVQICQKSGEDHQKWKIVKNRNKTYTIYSKSSGMVLDIAGGTLQNGTNVQIYKPNMTQAQQFTIAKHIPYDPADVEVSVESGAYADDSLTVAFASAEGYTIHYTLDGSVPTEDSPVCEDSLVLDPWSTPDTLSLPENVEKTFSRDGYAPRQDDTLPRATVVRAVAIAPDGVTGPVQTRTYFIGLDIAAAFNGAPVVSIVTDPENLLNYNTGIMVKGAIYDNWAAATPNAAEIEQNQPWEVNGNFRGEGRDWERDADISFFDGSNTLSWTQAGGIRLKGDASRTYAQKGFNVYFRKEYGSKTIKYELFSDAIGLNGSAITKYKQFTLRNGGNDFTYTKFRDLLHQDLVKDLDVSTQSGKPAILFLNGEYWGVCELQEKYCDKYFEEHYGVAEENLIVIKCGGVDDGIESDQQLYDQMRNYAYKDLSDPATYAGFCSLVDIDSMIDYFATQIYLGNADWDEFWNSQLWRARTPDGTTYGDGKWRWCLYDTECATGMRTDDGLDRARVDYDSFTAAMQNTVFFGAAMNNEEFRRKFLARITKLSQTNFEGNYVCALIDQYAEEWGPYMADDYKRFGDRSDEWNDTLDILKDFFTNRAEYIVTYVQDYVDSFDSPEGDENI